MVTKMTTDPGDDVVIRTDSSPILVDGAPKIVKALTKTQTVAPTQPLTGCLAEETKRPPILVDNNYREQEPSSAAPASPSKTPAAQFPNTPQVTVTERPPILESIRESQTTEVDATPSKVNRKVTLTGSRVGASVLGGSSNQTRKLKKRGGGGISKEDREWIKRIEKNGEESYKTFFN